MVVVLEVWHEAGWIYALKTKSAAFKCYAKSPYLSSYSLSLVDE